MRKYGETFALPNQHGGNGTFTDYFEWMVENPAALGHAFKFFPYPEIVAQQCPNEWLLKWGEAEVFSHQILILRLIAADGESDDRARSLCQSWLEKCEMESREDAYKHAASADNWRELGRYVSSGITHLKYPYNTGFCFT